MSPASASPPPYSYSFYPTAYDLIKANTVVYGWGKNAPAHSAAQVLLEVGGWCTGDTTDLFTYGGSCTSEWNVAFDLEYYMDGYGMKPPTRTSRR